MILKAIKLSYGFLEVLEMKHTVKIFKNSLLDYINACTPRLKVEM